MRGDAEARWRCTWPMPTEMTVMTARAPAQPTKVSSLFARAARSAAMKNVLSPISETKISDDACVSRAAGGHGGRARRAGMAGETAGGA